MYLEVLYSNSAPAETELVSDRLHYFPPSLLPSSSFLSSIFVSKHGATSECCTACFNQRTAKRRLRDQASSHKSLMQDPRCPENSSEETTAVRHTHLPKDKDRRPS